MQKRKLIQRSKQIDLNKRPLDELVEQDLSGSNFPIEKNPINAEILSKIPFQNLP